MWGAKLDVIIDLKPEILTHPHIPKPLHGLNPRTLKEREWWDMTRQAAYKRTNYHCVACGVHKQDAKKHQWLEAHEYFDINYRTGRCEVISIEPLCHYCHNFIHSGRLYMILGKEKTRDEVIEILEHGFKILKEHKFRAFYATVDVADMVGARTFDVKSWEPKGKELAWTDYRLVLEGVEYQSKFTSFSDWRRHYSE